MASGFSTLALPIPLLKPRSNNDDDDDDDDSFHKELVDLSAAQQPVPCRFWILILYLLTSIKDQILYLRRFLLREVFA